MAAGKRDKLGEDLSAYLDGELPPERARAIEKQLAESAECRATLERLRDAADVLSGLPRLRAPDELTAAMHRHAERHELLDTPPRTTSHPLFHFGLRMTAAAAILVGCIWVCWEVGHREGLLGTTPPQQENIGNIAHAEKGGVPADKAPIAGGDAVVYSYRHELLSDSELTETRAPAAADALEPGPPIAARADPARAVREQAEEVDSARPTPTLAAVGERLGQTPAGTPGESGSTYLFGSSFKQVPLGQVLGDGNPIDVWIRPQTAEEYAGAYAVLTGGVAGVAVDGSDWIDADLAYSTSARSNEILVFAWDVDSDGVSDLIAGLERQIPERVYFARHVPDEAGRAVGIDALRVAGAGGALQPPASDEKSQKEEVRSFAEARRGAEVERRLTPTLGVAVTPELSKEDRRGRKSAPTEAGAADDRDSRGQERALARRHPRARPAAEPKAEAQVEGVPAAVTEPSASGIRPHVLDSSEVVSPRRKDARVDPERASPQVERGSTLELIVAGWKRAWQPPPARKSADVRLRVTLVPPPTPATQPASRPAAETRSRP